MARLERSSRRTLPHGPSPRSAGGLFHQPHAPGGFFVVRRKLRVNRHPHFTVVRFLSISLTHSILSSSGVNTSPLAEDLGFSPGLFAVDHFMPPPDTHHFFLMQGLQTVAAVSAVSVPEPATVTLLGLALAGFGFARKRSRGRQSTAGQSPQARSAPIPPAGHVPHLDERPDKLADCGSTHGDDSFGDAAANSPGRSSGVDTPSKRLRRYARRVEERFSCSRDVLSIRANPRSICRPPPQ